MQFVRRKEINFKVNDHVVPKNNVRCKEVSTRQDVGYREVRLYLIRKKVESININGFMAEDYFLTTQQYPVKMSRIGFAAAVSCENDKFANQVPIRQINTLDIHVKGLLVVSILLFTITSKFFQRIWFMLFVVIIVCQCFFFSF